MRFVVIGAGAVGGVVGGRLAQHGHDVLLVARSDHGAAIASDGLLLRDPDGEVRVHPPVVNDVRDLELGPTDVVLLAVKSQDTDGVLTALATAGAPADLPVACLQNGVDNERRVLRRFARVYAVPVMLPSTHLVPGVVDAWSTPVTGILDVGRYPTGVDDLAADISAAFAAASFSSEPRAEVMRFKWAKLLMNLGNAIEAAVGSLARDSELYRRARAEGEAVLTAAGIDFASREEDLARRGDLLRMRPIAGERRGGGSSWQSLARGTGTIEADALNGEIVLLGRLHGVETPVNALLQQVANDLARAGSPPGTMTEAALLARI